MVNFGEVRMVQLTKSTLLTFTPVPLRSFKVCSDAKERVGCGKQWEATTPIHPYSVFLFLQRVVIKLSSEVGCGEVTNPK